MSGLKTRRDLLSTALRSGAGMATAAAIPGWLPATALGSGEGSRFRLSIPAGAEQLGVVPFDVEWAEAFDKPIGQGLNGRVIHKLAALTPDTLITPSEHFFVRTGKPALLGPTDNWKIAVNGLVDEPMDLAVNPLLSLAESQGVHLLECSGNPRRRSFGLMSACEWGGIPAVDLLELTRPLSSATRVLIGGFDKHTSRGGGVPGASWVFDPGDLEAAGAFFATHMNGERLPDDHGYPIRLFIPGWYGCAAAKWVDRIEWVNDLAPATTQMKEYASRTGNDGIPELAGEYVRGEMDLAAMPVRVEKWSEGGQPYYRVVGIAWGGKRTVSRLEIRFNVDAPWVPIDDFEHRSVTTWNIWSHTWRPPEAGSYTIRLRFPDSTVPTRRIDRGYYDRTVTISDA